MHSGVQQSILLERWRRLSYTYEPASHGSHAFQARDKNVLISNTGIFPASTGEKLRQNPWYNFSNTTIYNDTLWSKAEEDLEEFDVEDLKAQANYTFSTKTANL